MIIFVSGLLSPQLPRGPHNSLQLWRHCNASVQCSRVSCLFIFHTQNANASNPCASYHYQAFVWFGPAHIWPWPSGQEEELSEADQLSQGLLATWSGGSSQKSSLWCQDLVMNIHGFSIIKPLCIYIVISLTKCIAQFDTCQPKLNLWCYLNAATDFNLQSGHGG